MQTEYALALLRPPLALSISARGWALRHDFCPTPYRSIWATSLIHPPNPSYNSIKPFWQGITSALQMFFDTSPEI